VLNKEQWIARHRSGDMTYSALALDSVSVRLYGDTAVLIGRQTQDAAYRGNSVMTQLRATLVMVRKQGNWQLASTHFSSITPPPGGTRG
jgi:hypothetical protein